MEWFALAVLCALTVGGQPPGECLADAGTVCESVKTTPLIFLGEVKNVNWDPRDQTRPPGPQIVTFRVLEGLKGVTGAEITLSFAAAGEQPEFMNGQRELVYARRSLSSQEWFASCSRSRSVAPDDPEVLALRNVIRGVVGAVVEGSLLIDATARKDVRVTAKSPGTEVGTKVLLNGGGRYLLWLPPGRYTLRFDAPDYESRTIAVVVSQSDRCVTVEPVVLNRVTTPKRGPTTAAGADSERPCW